MNLLKSTAYNDTLNIAENFAKVLKPNIIVGLSGDLGTGKTVFVKGVAQALGYDLAKVSSPTFTIVNIYKADIPIFHFDLYRIHSQDEFETIGFYDYVDSDGICFIEWIDNFDLLKRDLDIKITLVSETKREFEFIPRSDKGKKVIDEYDTCS